MPAGERGVRSGRDGVLGVVYCTGSARTQAWTCSRCRVADAVGEVKSFRVEIVLKEQLKGEKSQYVTREEESAHPETGVRSPCANPVNPLSLLNE